MGIRYRYRQRLKRKKAYHKRRQARLKAVIEAQRKSKK